MLFKLSVYPVGQSEAYHVLSESGLPFTFSPGGSIVEGDWDQVLPTLGDVYRAIHDKHRRVFMTVHALDEENASSEVTLGRAPRGAIRRHAG